MTTVQAEKIARRKLSLRQLAQELGNVSKACRILGCSRQHFYEIRRSFQVHGAGGLLDRLPGAKGTVLQPLVGKCGMRVSKRRVETVEWCVDRHGPGLVFSDLAPRERPGGTGNRRFVGAWAAVPDAQLSVAAPVPPGCPG